MRNDGNEETVRMMIGSGESSLFVKVKKGEKIMIGEGESSIFVEAGLTPEESLKRIDDRIDQIVEKYSKEQRKESVKQKVLNRFRKK